MRLRSLRPLRTRRSDRVCATVRCANERPPATGDPDSLDTGVRLLMIRKRFLSAKDAKDAKESEGRTNRHGRPRNSGCSCFLCVLCVLCGQEKGVGHARQFDGRTSAARPRATRTHSTLEFGRAPRAGRFRDTEIQSRDIEIQSRDTEIQSSDTDFGARETGAGVPCHWNRVSWHWNSRGRHGNPVAFAVIDGLRERARGQGRAVAGHRLSAQAAA